MDLSRTAFTLLSRPWSIYQRAVQFLPPLQAREYAARKGTREKARKKKVKVEVKKVGFIPHKLREKQKDKVTVSRRINEDHKKLPIDDVWITRFHQSKVYDFSEAVECHRETHHPHIYNCPNAPIKAFIELDLKSTKKNKYVEPFNKIAKIPNVFDHGEKRSILVFCKTQEVKDEAENAGANLIFDVDFVKKIQKGDVMLPDFQFILAHPNILAELVSLRPILRKKFPNPRDETLGPDIGNMVKTFQTGIHYYAMREESELDYGWIDTSIGTINMSNKQLEENMKYLLEDINKRRPKREGPFITRVLLKSEPSIEKFKIDLVPFLGEEEGKQDDGDSDDEELTIQQKT
ncbi:uncharacterized protein LOC106660813 [Cimex lectularius]|uniref:39S ribosomal protein L1, mitochondrial n=1 Tax=Cimex lectularius TaxID=79782 RepID=A0A8I6R5K7_CIMLE|nr:uncharacterized protein LOC106660813 [Cimex lectularius]